MHLCRRPHTPAAAVAALLLLLLLATGAAAAGAAHAGEEGGLERRKRHRRRFGRHCLGGPNSGEAQLPGAVPPPLPTCRPSSPPGNSSSTNEQQPPEARGLVQPLQAHTQGEGTQQHLDVVPKGRPVDEVLRMRRQWAAPHKTAPGGVFGAVAGEQPSRIGSSLHRNKCVRGAESIYAAGVACVHQKHLSLVCAVQPIAAGAPRMSRLAVAHVALVTKLHRLT
jgi:hypothetical protein